MDLAILARPGGSESALAVEPRDQAQQIAIRGAHTASGDRLAEQARIATPVERDRSAASERDLGRAHRRRERWTLGDRTGALRRRRGEPGGIEDHPVERELAAGSGIGGRPQRNVEGRPVLAAAYVVHRDLEALSIESEHEARIGGSTGARRELHDRQ